jgi:CheY-like chemotaxis protein
VARILGRRGYHVRTAGGVAAALAELDAMPARPDLLIADVRMPDGTGAELVDRVRTPDRLRVPRVRWIDLATGVL